MRTPWRDYLSDFHAERPGITEQLLQRTRDAAGRTPYDWVADAVPRGTAVLDLACGSAPLAERLVASYLGIDLSAPELALARSKGAPVVRADAGRLPVADEAVDVVVVSMALMLVPLSATLAEVRRVLRPGGRLVALLPATGPMPARDLLRFARLCVALRHRGLAYPNDAALADGVPGFATLTDARVGFRCEIDSDDTAQLLLRSLYLPEVGPERMAHGAAVVSRWVGTSMTTPLRLLVAEPGA